MEYRNPILTGFNPDPSICRVGEDYYIVTSSFEYFPGVPIYHSKNLINWMLIGYCLTKESQSNLQQTRASGGIFAPTLYYHAGIFYMTTTNVDKGNFIVYTEEINGEWSDPVWVDQRGIDPSLLFDEDGTVYFLSADMDGGESLILLAQINPLTGERLTESNIINRGCGGRYPEAPHLYQWFGQYYLMLAEGGTEYGHMETMQRADNPYGPYEQCPGNPILTHRNDMRDEIYCTGHADIVQDHQDNWWLVCLGVRPCGGKNSRLMLHHLGRETFLSPLKWDKEGWPIVGEGGKISLEMSGDIPGEAAGSINSDFEDDFSVASPSLYYNYLRNPVMKNYERDTLRKELQLTGTEITLNDGENPTWIEIRQKGFETINTVTAGLLVSNEQTRIGLTAFYNEAYHYEIYLTSEGGRNKICFAKHIHDLFAETERVELPKENQEVELQIRSDAIEYIFSYRLCGREFIELGRGLAIGLATEGTKTMTFTGTYIALFAENGKGFFRDLSMKVLDH